MIGVHELMYVIFEDASMVPINELRARIKHVILGCFASGIRKRFQHNQIFGSLLNRFSGLVFVGLGLTLSRRL